VVVVRMGGGSVKAKKGWVSSFDMIAPLYKYIKYQTIVDFFSRPSPPSTGDGWKCGRYFVKVRTDSYKRQRPKKEILQ
jgi:hypothetical protein